MVGLLYLLLNGGAYDRYKTFLELIVFSDKASDEVTVFGGTQYCIVNRLTY